MYILSSGVNNTEPRLLVIDTEPRLSFSVKNISRAETLTKRARAELRLWVTETTSFFRFEHHVLHH